MPHQPPSQSKLALATISSLLWPWFLIWSALAAVVMPFGIGGHHLQEWVSNTGLQQALGRLLQSFDSIWFVLAAANVYFFTVAAEGQTVARRWAMTILGATTLLVWIGATTGFPFGPFHFTGRLGLRFGPNLSLAVPLLVLTILLASRYTVLALLPRARGWKLALGTATLFLLTDLNLDRVAWKARYYWRWTTETGGLPSGAPLQNFVAWFVAAFLLTLLLKNPNPSRPQSALKPIIVLALLNVIFLAVNLTHPSSNHENRPLLPVSTSVEESAPGSSD